MSERPGVQTPWRGVNQLLAPDERFEVHFPYWKGCLLAPKHSSQLAALLYFLHQEEIKFCIQGKGTHSLPAPEHTAIVSARAFSHIFWHDQGVVEVGAGCSLSHLHQFLLENNQEVALEEDPLSSLKRSVAGLLLSGRTSGLRYRTESFLDTLLGIEFVTWEGSQVKWGGRQRCEGAGPTLHKLMWGLQTFPGVIIKILLKTHPIPPVRLRLAWSFRQKETMWQHFHELKCISLTWEYLDMVLSGKSGDQGFVLAQISGRSEEMESFSQVCPRYTMASQQGERDYLKHFFSQKKLKAHLASIDSPLESEEYLWIQDWDQKAWLLTSRSIQENLCPEPIWKQRLWKSLKKS